MNQLTHYNSKFKKQKKPVTLLCDGVTNAPNIGGLFRIADAFNIQEIIFCGDNISIGKRMAKTSRSTQNYVNYSIAANINTEITKIKARNCYILALEITDTSKPISELKLETNLPIALIIGNENFGVTDTVLKQCHNVLHINMYGNNSSMNVVQATSIALYEIVKQLNR